MSVVVGVVGGAGSLLALLGVYLDDAWHTDVGRDGFFSPPHLLLYAGVLTTSLSVLVWVVRSWRQAGGGAAGAADVLRSPAIWLAGVGGVTTVLSAPLDDAWHRLFGRDAVLWSPPHLAAVAGTCALAVGLLAGLQTSRGRGAGTARVLAAAAVVGSLQVLVLEYDSDVPQFSPTWYLPVAASGVCLALVIVEDLFPGGRALLQVAVAYTAVRVLVVAVLAALGSSLTIVTPVALALGLAFLLRGTRRVWRLVLVGAAVPLLWWPALVVQAPTGTTVALTTLPLAVALSAAGALAVAVLHGDVRGVRLRADASAGAVVVLLALSFGTPEAAAHDPGQGPVVEDVRVEAARTGSLGSLEVTTSSACPDAGRTRVVARRAGLERSDEMTVEALQTGCLLTGSVGDLSPGRWFLYAEISSPSDVVREVWLPTPSDGERAAADRQLYEVSQQRTPPWRPVAEVLTLGAAGAILLACLQLSRRASRTMGQQAGDQPGD